MIRNIFSPKKMVMGIAAITMALSASVSFAKGGIYDTYLSGANSVPPVHSTATGSSSLILDEVNNLIHYSMYYKALEGVPTAAHIHFASKIANGPALFTICNNDSTTIRNCPTSPGWIKGTFNASDVLPIPSQNVHAGDMAAAMLFIKFGLTYVNVHSQTHPNVNINELRGQLSVYDHPIASAKKAIADLVVTAAAASTTAQNPPLSWKKDK